MSCQGSSWTTFPSDPELLLLLLELLALLLGTDAAAAGGCSAAGTTEPVADPDPSKADVGVVEALAEDVDDVAGVSG